MLRLLHLRGRSILVALTAIAAGGCASLETIAPPVTPALVRASRGVPAGILEEGRRIFTGACTACHAADPVAKHSASEWRTIVADMAVRTKLSPSREAALLAYLTAVCATPPAP